MKPTLQAIALAVLTAGSVCAAQAQQNILKVGVIEYTTNSKTNGIQGIGVPPGADAETGNAATLLFTYERLFTPNVGLELVIGVPPKIQAKATGSVAFLGDDVLGAQRGADADPQLPLRQRRRPLPPLPRRRHQLHQVHQREVQARARREDVGYPTGLVVQAGLDYAFDKTWGLFASVARVDTKSKLVAAGTTVLTTEIDFRPVTHPRPVVPLLMRSAAV